ncbi:hypothetical protein BH09PLA1_BH09PLA1_09880 [soil metagenome]
MGKFITPIESLERRQLLSAVIRVDVNSNAANPDGATWDTAYADLQQALAIANFGDEIRVADGTYKPTSGIDRTISFNLKDGVSIFGGYAGVGASDPDARDVEQFVTVLSGNIGDAAHNDDNSGHVLLALPDSQVTAATIIDGVTITDGYADNPSGSFNLGGGGMCLYDASPTVRACKFVSNFAAIWGAGAYALSTASPSFTDCYFQSNRSIPNTTYLTAGGGLSFTGASGLVSRCVFDGNFSSNFGGGIFLGTSSAIVTDCRFTGNQALAGGGIGVNGGSTIGIDRCLFQGNRSYAGGGVRLANFGGYGSGTSTGSIANSAFVGNVADMFDNTARGGAIENFATQLLVQSCSIVSNSAIANSGGVAGRASSSTIVTNSVTWANSAATDSQMGASVLARYVDSDGGFPGTGNINADPQFVRNPSPGADNTWGTADDDYGDLRLQITSPCIDAGNNASVPAGVTTDIAGRNRFFDFPGVNNGAGAIVDMGANELDLTLGLLRVAAGQTIALPAGGHTFFVERFDLQPNATLDLRDDSLIIDYSGASELAATQLLINSARDGGAWNGIGITSTSAKNNPLHNTTLGAMEASDFKSIYGTAALFGGHAIDSTAVLVKYTYYGDADFNGVVNFDDYSRADAGFNGNRSGWLNGDFDANGIVNFDDYSLIDLAFNTQGAPLRPIVAGRVPAEKVSRSPLPEARSI